MSVLYVDGRFVDEREAAISPLDRGFLFADAIYEVVRYDRGRPYRLAEHLDRMRDGLDAIAIASTPDFFPSVAERLLTENGLAEEDAFVYAQVSRGAGASLPRLSSGGHAPDGVRVRAQDRSAAARGGRHGAILLTDERWGRCDIKSVMLLPNVLAAQKAKQAGAIDAILVRDGFALEGTKANLFSVAKGVVRMTSRAHARLL